jgi:hypothetical protein
MCRLTILLVNIYTFMIGMQRLVTKARPGQITLRAARRVANIIVQFHTDPTLTGMSCNITYQ